MTHTSLQAWYIDRISYQGERVCRLFPSTLDPMFALGNNAAAQLLIPELDEYHYGTNLAALRYLFDSFPPEYWETTMYKRWLGMIKTLNPPEDRGRSTRIYDHCCILAGEA